MTATEAWSTASVTTTEASSTTGSNTGGTSSGVCEDPDEAGGTPVTITLRNLRDQWIYLRRESASVCASVPWFEIKPGILTFLQGGEFCEWSCRSVLLDGGCGCPAGCGSTDAVIAVGPGEVVSAQWSGMTYRGTKLDAACGIEGGCSECMALVKASARTYSVWVRVSDEAVDGVQTGVIWTVTAPLDFPAQTAVEVLVQ